MQWMDAQQQSLALIRIHSYRDYANNQSNNQPVGCVFFFIYIYFRNSYNNNHRIAHRIALRFAVGILVSGSYLVICTYLHSVCSFVLVYINLAMRFGTHLIAIFTAVWV